MNQNHVIDSWVAELALSARASRIRSQRQLAAAIESEAGTRPALANPVGRRIAALLERPRSSTGSLRPCLPIA